MTCAWGRVGIFIACFWKDGMWHRKRKEGKAREEGGEGFDKMTKQQNDINFSPGTTSQSVRGCDKFKKSEATSI